MTVQSQQTTQTEGRSRIPNLSDRHKLYPFLVFILFLAYWLVVYLLERVHFQPDTFRVPLPDIVLSFLAFFHPKVLRHLIPWILGLFLAYQAAVNLLWRLYDLTDRQEAIDFLHRLRTPGNLADIPLTVTPQNLEESREKAVSLRIGGPGRITIPIGMVATTEINGRFYRILDSGNYDLERFEFIHKIIDLRPQERASQAAKFTTKDGFFVTADLGAAYRVRGNQQATLERPYPYNNDTIRALAYDETLMGSGKINDWTAMPARTVQGTVVGIISKLTLADLVKLPEENNLDPYLTVRLEHQARKTLEERNIELIRTWVSNVKLPTEATEQYLALWKVDEAAQTKIILAEGEALAIEELEIAQAEAELTMIKAIAEGVKRANRAGYTSTINEIVALRLIEAMEKLARQSQDATTLPDNLLPQIYNLQNQLLLESHTPNEENSHSERT